MPALGGRQNTYQDCPRTEEVVDSVRLCDLAWVAEVVSSRTKSPLGPSDSRTASHAASLLSDACLRVKVLFILHQ